jgi:hypothetical protein
MSSSSSSSSSSQAMATPNRGTVLQCDTGQRFRVRDILGRAPNDQYRWLYCVQVVEDPSTTYWFPASAFDKVGLTFLQSHEHFNDALADQSDLAKKESEFNLSIEQCQIQLQSSIKM